MNTTDEFKGIDAELTRIVQEAAKRMEGVTVDANSSMSMVSITDDDTGDDVFLQGEAADDFCNEVDSLWNRTGGAMGEECELCIAESYTELFGQG